MATTPVEILLAVRDEASAQLKNLSKQLSGLGDVGQRLSATFGFSGSAMLDFGAKAAVLGTGITAMGGAVAAFAIKMSDQVEQLDNLSARTGVSAHDLQVLQFAFKQGGVEADALTAGLSFMQRAIDQSDPALKKLGVTSRDTFEAFMQASRGLAAISDSAERTNLMFQIFGRGGSQMLPIMQQLAGGFDSIAAAAQRSGNVMNEVQLKALGELDHQMDRLTATAMGLGKRFAVTVGGPLEKMAEQINNAYDAWARLSSLSNFMRWYVEHFMGAQVVKGGTGGGVIEFNGVEADADRITPMGRMGPIFSPEEIARMQGSLAKPGILSDVRWQGRTLPGEDPQGGLRGGVEKELQAIGPVLDEAQARLVTFSDLLEQHAARWRDAFKTFGDSAFNGFMTVFANLQNKAQTFHVAFVTIIQSMAQGVELAIGQLVSSLAVKSLLKLLGIALSALTGNPFAAFGAAAAGEGFAPLTSGPVSAGAPLSMGTARGGNTYIIQTLSPGSVLAALRSPTGSMRTAYDRLNEVAAAS